MRIINTVAELQQQSDSWRSQGLRIGLVPTMGYFHEGHLALMRCAAGSSDRVVTTLFVNPTQFGPGEDLDAYPRDFVRDRQLAESVGVDILFCPEVDEMYGQESETRVVTGQLAKRLCGASRPGHFDGVVTIVTKLFLASKPHVAVFGQKDFQQLAIIRRMVDDLKFDIEIIGHPIVREADGLAMSSRNTYLDKDGRKAAVCLHESLCMAQAMYGAGPHPLAAAKVADLVARHIEQYPQCKVDYVAIVHNRTLEPVEICDENSHLVLAVRVNDKVRLIDNGPLATAN